MATFTTFHLSLILSQMSDSLKVLSWKVILLWKSYSTFQLWRGMASYTEVLSISRRISGRMESWWFFSLKLHFSHQVLVLHLSQKLVCLLTIVFIWDYLLRPNKGPERLQRLRWSTLLLHWEQTHQSHQCSFLIHDNEEWI